MAAPSYEFLTACRFYLELILDGSTEADAIFLECRGIRAKQPVVDIYEVTPQRWGGAKHGLVVSTKMPGNTQRTTLILRRGMSSSIVLWNWFYAVEQGGWAAQRRSGSLTMYTQSGDPTARFDFDGAWPTSFGPASGKFSYIETNRPGLDASSSDFALEEVELAVEEFKRVM
ncbi:phage tail protein [Gloeobacter morelensis]|uniref:Phage tail protein n=1 Tax=Gloeobacter morelensis MG652769 TaxID=2781736 RepID=A0ABY3PN95_9CYAN|nr:phage tail protein [Gloeobacter morelensis]UFP95156.1 phage tail protein [Gloeobacter morelensis MG652769]